MKTPNLFHPLQAPTHVIQPKFSKNYPTLLEKFKNQADFAQIGKKLLDFLLRV